VSQCSGGDGNLSLIKGIENFSR
jgi:hypothetical protein